MLPMLSPACGTQSEPHTKDDTKPTQMYIFKSTSSRIQAGIQSYATLSSRRIGFKIFIHPYEYKNTYTKRPSSVPCSTYKHHKRNSHTGFAERRTIETNKNLSVWECAHDAFYCHHHHSVWDVFVGVSSMGRICHFGPDDWDNRLYRIEIILIAHRATRWSSTHFAGFDCCYYWH